MVETIIHIGFGKCGSTALQYSLSNTPILKANRKKYKNIKYITIDKNGQLYSGNNLRERLLFTASRSLSTASLTYFKGFSDEILNALRVKLSKLSNNNNSLLVLSCESWVKRADIFRENAILEKLNMRAQVICYARNPVEWINSAWWQWGAWSNQNLDSYIDRMVDKRVSKWSNELEEWRNIVGPENLKVKILPNDIVEDFYNMIGVELTSDQDNRANSSLPKEILRFYQQHRELRKSEHENQLDFILSRYLKLDSTFSKAPWVLSEEQVDRILKKTKESNIKLMEFIDPDSRKMNMGDERWWSKTAFEKKTISPACCKEKCLAYEELDKLLLAAIKGIEKLYIENMQLKKIIKKGNRKVPFPNKKQVCLPSQEK
ncbi:hypothetical protein YH65_10250 [Sulfurovum lithotrophicum]|uniref:Sulfotransferase domain-containing protein n=1 Tax=Sulfurovum lithotrophicum TaxID=206403 RepID=A0A7U4M2L2_9BACT|nr:sulfotransferase family protein [Sulfurovum lithotrophicum]AKF25724.1 hypothetical protein YH65_10250 [Sulfurovum lithotrophicum]